MAVKWIKAKSPGVRYHEHGSRKNGVRFDRYYSIRYKLNGKDKEEGLGWASQGWTEQKAVERLAELKQNQRTGEGAQTLQEKREKAKEQRQAEKEAQEQAQKENITIKQYFKDIYYPAAMTHKKKQSYSKEETHFRLWIAPVIGDKPLKEVAEFDVRRINKKILAAGKAPRTAQYILATLRQIWNMACRDGIVTGASPTRNVKIPKFDNRRKRFLSHSEAIALLCKLKERNEQIYRMAFLALHTGMRASEIFKLTWGCIDSERGIITILDAKSGKGRVAFMTAQIKEMFSNMTSDSEKRKNDDLVFPNRDGNVYTEISIIFRNAVVDLKFNENVSDPRQRVMFHTLRHTFGSWHAEAGTDLYVIKELLGHGSIQLTERYSHLSNGILSNATKTLENVMRNAEKDRDKNIISFNN